MRWAGFDYRLRYIPILNLGLIGRLELLPSLYEQVLMPAAVFQELTHSDCEPKVLAPTSSWVVVAQVRNQAEVNHLCGQLDSGEAEAIVLAEEKGADLLLMDERCGRRIAASRGLGITGLLGVLAEAKQAGLIETVQPLLDDLTQRAGFWIGAHLSAKVLAQVGED